MYQWFQEWKNYHPHCITKGNYGTELSNDLPQNHMPTLQQNKAKKPDLQSATAVLQTTSQSLGVCTALGPKSIRWITPNCYKGDLDPPVTRKVPK